MTILELEPRRRGPVADRRLPFEDLERYCHAQWGEDPDLQFVSVDSHDDRLWTDGRLAWFCDTARATMMRYRNGTKDAPPGIPLFSADRIAIQLGTHPLLIWPDAYIDIAIELLIDDMQEELTCA